MCSAASLNCKQRLKAAHQMLASSSETERGQSWVTMVSAGGQPGDNLGSTWGQPGDNLRSSWGEPGVILGTWGQHAVNMGSTWGQPGVNLGSTSGQLGVNLRSTWGQPGVNLGLSWGQNCGQYWVNPAVNLHRLTTVQSSGARQSTAAPVPVHQYHSAAWHLAPSVNAGQQGH